MDKNDPNPDTAIINAALEILTATKKVPTDKIGDASKNSGADALDAGNIMGKLGTEVPLDWRLSVSQTERFQVIQRLSHEILQSVAPEHKNDVRISQIAQQIEKRFFESSNSKMNYFTNLKSQIFEIQKKTLANNLSQAQVAIAPGISNASSPAGPVDNAANPVVSNQDQIMNDQGQSKVLPAVLTLSDTDKNIVREKLNQLSHLFPKIGSLITTISNLGTKGDLVQLHKLANIKKAIDYQVEGFKIDRYTISVEAANNLQPTLMRYFQYGGILIKQSQERSAQLRLLMENNKQKNNMFNPVVPQSQPNVPPQPQPNVKQGQNTPQVAIVGNETANKALKLNAQMKQQLFIQKINQKQAKNRPNVTTARPVFTQQDLDSIFSDTSPAEAETHDQNDITKPTTQPDNFDFSLYFNLDDSTESTSPSVPNISNKRKSSASSDTMENAKKQKTKSNDLTDPNQAHIKSMSFNTLLDEIHYLEKEFGLSFEIIELDRISGDIITNPKTQNDEQNQSPKIAAGKIVVFSYLPRSSIRIIFRLSSRNEYEQAINDRKSCTSIVQANFFEKFRNSGLGLEDVEVVSDNDLENLSKLVKITSFATNLGVGITGNMVQITDILRYALEEVI